MIVKIESLKIHKDAGITYYYRDIGKADYRTNPGRFHNLKTAVFLDRDGTVTEEVGYINHPSRLRLLPKSAAGIARLNSHNIPVILVTNQAGVARGYFTEDLINKVHDGLKEMLLSQSSHLDAVYYCPHHPSAGEPPYRIECNCRKPKPGMLLKAAEDLGIDLPSSYMVGDKISDIRMAHESGLKGVLVKTGYGLGEYEYQRESWPTYPDYIAEDLDDAARWIIDDLARRYE